MSDLRITSAGNLVMKDLSGSLKMFVIDKESGGVVIKPYAESAIDSMRLAKPEDLQRCINGFIDAAATRYK